MTGASSSVLLALVPIADSASSCLHLIKPLGLILGSNCFTLACWIDNLLSFGENANACVAILRILERVLFEKWGLVYGNNSKEVLILPGGTPLDASHTAAGWESKSSMKTLGSIICGNGSVVADVAETKQRVRRCWLGNLSRKALVKPNGHSIKSKIKLLDRALLPILASKAVRWPPIAPRAKWFDKFQHDLLAPSLPLPGIEGESTLQWFNRRANFTKLCLADSKSWSASIEKRQKGYLRHLARHESLWPHILMKWRQTDWWRERRSTWGSSMADLAAGRTMTRLMAQKVQPRFHEALTKRGWKWPEEESP